MLNFCTLFNINYLSRGLAMYESLKKECEQPFTLYVFAFDDITASTLSQLNLSHLVVITLQEFETEALLEVKKSRTMAEYCWTSTPFTLLHCIEKLSLGHCTYLDADLYFYNSPQWLMNEIGDASVYITPHHYSLNRDQSGTAGIYCVQFLYFKNDAAGLALLKRWAGQCLEWCYARYEDGKFGDQKYLDCWPYTYGGVKVCRHHGAGLAPWNVERFVLIKQNGQYLVGESGTTPVPLVFYHYHYLKIDENDRKYIGNYHFPKNVINELYYPYFEALKRAESIAKPIIGDHDPHGKQKSFPIKSYNLRDTLYLYRKNVFSGLKRFLADLSGKSTKKEMDQSTENYLS